MSFKIFNKNKKQVGVLDSTKSYNAIEREFKPLTEKLQEKVIITDSNDDEIVCFVKEDEVNCWVWNVYIAEEKFVEFNHINLKKAFSNWLRNNKGIMNIVFERKLKRLMDLQVKMDNLEKEKHCLKEQMKKVVLKT